MLKKMINKLREKKRLLQTVGDYKIPNVIEYSDFEIKLTKESNYFRMIISDYISLVDYVERMKVIDKFGVEQMVSNAVLWNSQKQKVNRGIYFIIFFENKLYNILVNEDVVKIDERIKNAKVEEEKVLLLVEKDNDYSYTYHKHDEFGDTFFTRYFNKRGFSLGKLDLSLEEFICDYKVLVNNLKEIKNIDEIMDLKLLEQIVYNDLEEKTKILS